MNTIVAIFKDQLHYDDFFCCPDTPTASTAYGATKKGKTSFPFSAFM